MLQVPTPKIYVMTMEKYFTGWLNFPLKLAAILPILSLLRKVKVPL